nr:hypothetical protein [Tanacetum cinerariifolium]
VVVGYCCALALRLFVQFALFAIEYTTQCHAEESEDSDTSSARSTSSDSTAPLLPYYPLTHTSPTLVLILRRTARMAVRVLPVMSPGLSSSIAGVAAMSNSAFHKRFRSSYETSPSSSPPDLPSTKRSRDSDSESEDVKENGLTSMNKGPAAGDEGLAAGDEGPNMRSVGEPLGLGYEVLRHQEIASREGQMPSVFEVGYGSRSVPKPERLERVLALRQPTLTTWIDLEDAPFTVPLPISSPMISLTVPSPVASPATAEAEGFLTELGSRGEGCSELWSDLKTNISPGVVGRMSTPVFVDPEISTQANEAQSSRVPVPFLVNPYEAIRQACIVEMDTEFEPFEASVKTKTPESPHTVASRTSLPDSTQPTCHDEESEDSDTSGVRSTSSDSTAPLLPDHPLTHTSPTLVLFLRRTARMAVHVPLAMLPGLSASIAGDLPSRKRSRGTSELVEHDEEEYKEDKEEEEEDEVDKSLDYDSEIEDVEDKGPTVWDEGPAAWDEGPAAGDEGLAARDEGLDMRVEILGLGRDEAVPEGQQRAARIAETAVGNPLGLGYDSLRRQEIASREGQMPSVFEVGQGSRFVPELKRPKRVSALRQPTLTTWIDPEDGRDYIDVPGYPPPAQPVQTPPSPDHRRPATTVTMLPPQEKFPAGLFWRNQKGSPRSDLSDPLGHSPSRAVAFPATSGDPQSTPPPRCHTTPLSTTLATPQPTTTPPRPCHPPYTTATAATSPPRSPLQDSLHHHTTTTRLVWIYKKKGCWFTVHSRGGSVWIWQQQQGSVWVCFTAIRLKGWLFAAVNSSRGVRLLFTAGGSVWIWAAATIKACLFRVY